MPKFCNAYGAENVSGGVNLGGFDTQPVAAQWVCDRRMGHRFVWACEHGHKSARPFELCESHYREFTPGFTHYPDGRPIPWTIRREVQFCPRCNAGIDLPRGVAADHRCKLELVAIS
jgi:hypothetical protein